MTLDTLRVLMVMRGKKGTAWILGFFQSVIFVLAITRCSSNLDNPLNMIGYAAGFATGNVVGMLIEEARWPLRIRTRPDRQHPGVGRRSPSGCARRLCDHRNPARGKGRHGDLGELQRAAPGSGPSPADH